MNTTGRFVGALWCPPGREQAPTTAGFGTLWSETPSKQRGPRCNVCVIWCNPLKSRRRGHQLSGRPPSSRLGRSASARGPPALRPSGERTVRSIPRTIWRRKSERHDASPGHLLPVRPARRHRAPGESVPRFVIRNRSRPPSCSARCSILPSPAAPGSASPSMAVRRPRPVSQASTTSTWSAPDDPGEPFPGACGQTNRHVRST